MSIAVDLPHWDWTDHPARPGDANEQRIWCAETCRVDADVFVTTVPDLPCTAPAVAVVIALSEQHANLTADQAEHLGRNLLAAAADARARTTHPNK